MNKQVPITSGVFIFNKKQELLICHPTNGSYTNNWSIPKGMLDKYESLEDAALREVFEETNLLLRRLELTYIGSMLYPKQNKELHAFITVIDDSNNLDLKCNSFVEKLNIPENDIIKFTPFESALELIHETQRKLILQYLETTK